MIERTPGRRQDDFYPRQELALMKKDLDNLSERVDAGFERVNKRLDTFAVWSENHVKSHFEDPRFMSFDVWMSHHKWAIMALLLMCGLLLGGAIAAGSEGVQAVSTLLRAVHR
jgi:hypothetical protein